MRATAGWAVVFMLISACGGSAAPSASSGPATTEGPTSTGPSTAITVVDGDSIVLADGMEARLIGINAPEGSECWGPEASAALTAAVEAADSVSFVGTGGEDQFGRSLGVLRLDGADANLALVGAGHAIATSAEHTDRLAYLHAENTAFTERLGLWAAGACGGAAPPRVVITAVDPNPPGRDEDALEDELVVITNLHIDAVELGGWVLRDESSRHRFVFPDDVTIAPGAELVVVTGCVGDDEDTVSWCAGGPVWNNDGDTALLLDPLGTVSSHLRYLGD